jgi:putative FmdB family regulatory protein
MPTYVYRCRDCDHLFEHFEKMTSTTRSRKCPACGGRGDRQISAGAGFLFKGEGFYTTDYRSEEYRSKHKADSDKAEPAASVPGGGAAAAAEAPADKTAAKPDAPKKRAGGGKKKKR